MDYAEVRIPISAKEMRHLNLPENPDDPSVEITLHDALDEKNQTIWPAQIIRTEGTLDENSLELELIMKMGHLPMKGASIDFGQKYSSRSKNSSKKDPKIFKIGHSRNYSKTSAAIYLHGGQTHKMNLSGEEINL